MDARLLDTCRYTGIKKTSANADDFSECSNCGGFTHKTSGSARRTTYDLTVDNKVASTTEVVPANDLLAQEANRCSHCGEVI